MVTPMGMAKVRSTGSMILMDSMTAITKSEPVPISISIAVPISFEESVPISVPIDFAVPVSSVMEKSSV